MIRRQAPMKATKMLPTNPTQPLVNWPHTNPPISAPTRPTTMSPSMPKPPPPITDPATHAVSVPYGVDQAEFAYVTQFGRHVVTVDGADDAGLHAKLPWPIQSVQRIDRRLQMFDLPGAELPTFDPEGKTIDKMLTVDG